jgi:predicted dehydrogenase
MLVDVVSRDTMRSTRIVGEEGTVRWTWPPNLLRLYKAKQQTWEEIQIDEGAPEKGYKAGEKMYVDEMSCFLGAVKGERQYIHNFDDDVRILRLLQAAERSATEGKHVKIAH